MKHDLDFIRVSLLDKWKNLVGITQLEKKIISRYFQP